MSDDLTREHYVACLKRVYGMVAAWEDAAVTSAPDWMETLVAERSREDLLKRDLRYFGVAVEELKRPLLPELTDTPTILGAMYVMEGSTLGGQLIARHVEQVLGLTDGRGSEFFRGHRDRTGPMWKEFCEVLRTQVPEDESDTVIRAAKSMFAAFGTWMRLGTALPGSKPDETMLDETASPIPYQSEHPYQEGNVRQAGSDEIRWSR